MIIQCTNCRAKFRIPDTKVKPQGTKARCAKCGQIFVAKLGENAYPDKKESANAKAKEPFSGNSLNIDDDKPLFKGSELALEGEASIRELIDEELVKSEVKAVADLERDLPETGRAEFPDSNTADLPREKSPVPEPDQQVAEQLPAALVAEEPRKMALARRASAKKDFSAKKSLYLLYPLVLVVALMGGLFFAGLSFPFKDISLLFSKAPDSIKPGLTVTAIGSEYVETVSGNSIFIINGTLFNNSSAPKAPIFLEAELRAANNSFILREKFQCCLSFSKLALHEISNTDSLRLMYKKDLTEELKPFESLPFTLVFKKPDESVKAYSINIKNE